MSHDGSVSVLMLLKGQRAEPNLTYALSSIAVKYTALKPERLGSEPDL